MKPFFTPLVVGDLDGILEFIAKSRPLTAHAVVARLIAKCKLIASQPELR